jgi:hypothetical protein
VICHVRVEKVRVLAIRVFLAMGVTMPVVC